ncbi:MAG: class I SAM-dependent methyltransferase [Burkholderiales bacterium]|nr:class I SAM-dependent methyltransferase [Burkholderiales bacterium]
MKNSGAHYVTACAVGCGAGLRDSGITLPEGPLRRCVECGQLLSSATEAQYLRSLGRFDNTAGTLPDATSQSRHDKNTARRLGKLAAALGRAPETIRLLDVGCSSGAFLRTACRLGYRAEGVEPSADAAQTARAAGLKVFTGYLEQAQFADATFDAITLIEIVEHLRDALGLMRECARILKPGGVVLVTTPNARSWTARAMGARWAGFSLNAMGGHISFFNPHSIAMLAARSGLAVHHIETRNVRFFERGQCSRGLHAAAKIAAELLNWPARLAGAGHDLHAYLRRPL